MLKMLHKEGNALVLANLVCALHEISETKEEKVFEMSKDILQKLLLALNECIEWGQIFIMDYLTLYNPLDHKEAEMIIERVLPRLSHINPTVVFSAVKLIVKYMDSLQS